ncbi:fumarate hydratase [candidate division WOR-1 bacterium RIFOXYA12_FULL_43_27]|uniref:Fumarate hydratase n=1 Tax=candidate division WOR-1 bacterium RIFOXYC2_FULL_46_14 TaxID=1802587 RepID=A0A1F4U560_UNCSA|nr:MAG: fumarate hydratase [candidate division WOR-1 bacterium RIFOXYA12_FULL_43_27]OGC20710.1 MAG: fumarate hydratase [candidate division WOR-1 bacterium RIFOXYB2_FULL_46_45]OGC31553.1 MAG: fumarate hydratase [candidate division WOR-1 bacterium RIFOXYA2_FULL_46_56]OGC39960.1 MAG: fumarate hydratase [candidate division WOR-1 bacterium RIFOXYC2_FULL_46_14]
MSKYYEIELPLKDEDIKKLKAGDRVALSGKVLTARDAAHQRVANILKKKKKPPFDPSGRVIFYAGPTPSRHSGRLIGAIGPTTSSRMDSYMPMMFKLGVRATIGKGPRSEEVKKLHKKYKAIYFVATGGVAALLSRHVSEAKKIAYEDLGPEAVLELKLYKFPVIVAYDAQGRDAFFH